MRRKDLSPPVIARYTNKARDFIVYITERGIDLDAVRPEDVESYLRARRQQYRRHHGHSPVSDIDWRTQCTGPVRILLRLVHGSWPPVAPCFEALKARLEREQLGSETISLYLYHARQFLAYLDRQQIPLERVSRQDLDSFLAQRLRSYRKRYGRSPRRQVDWRCTHTAAIHRLLQDAQGQWPPPSPDDADLQRFASHLVEQGRDRKYIAVWRRHARQFLDYLNQRGISVAELSAADVETYFRFAPGICKKRNPNRSLSPGFHRTMARRAVFGFLRFMQGEWPPDAGSQPLLADFHTHLERYRYRPLVITNYVSAARQFMLWLKQQDVPIEQAAPQHMEDFIQMKVKSRQRRGALPRNPARVRRRYSGPIRRLLRMLNPKWPPPEPPATDCERFHRDVLEGYRHWLIDVHGLSDGILRRNRRAADLFLHWLGDNAGRDSLPRIGYSEIDGYLNSRMQKLRRTTRTGVASSLRSFLRYLHADGIVPSDLSPLVSGPVLYKFEDIPRAFTEAQVKTMLDTTRRDNTPAGLRDYAILMLLATYGLRAGEVVQLRLDDIDWRAEKLRVRQLKTGNELLLPLVPAVGNALLNYLRRGRPQTELREVFLHARAPLGPFRSGSSLHGVVAHRLKEAGIQVEGRHGPHAFRFARAVSLLRGTVPVKIIGDLLGHRSAESTEVYLRLATDDLRAVSIDLPVKGKS
jgi:integrase/recombinase XerD